jgi:putative holliday junction resolvase
MRVLGIDPGSVRIGLALSDPSGTIAQPLSVLRRRSLPEDLQALRRICEEQAVDRIVVGLPRQMDGRLAAAAQNAQAFGDALEQATGRPVSYWDERLTTVAAERHLLAQGVRRAKRRADVDRIAAALLLQAFLDYQGRKDPGGRDGAGTRS